MTFAARKFDFYEEYTLPGDRGLVCRVGRNEYDGVDETSVRTIAGRLQQVPGLAPEMPHIDAKPEQQVSEWLRRPAYTHVRRTVPIGVYVLLTGELAAAIEPGAEFRL